MCESGITSLKSLQLDKCAPVQGRKEADLMNLILYLKTRQNVTQEQRKMGRILCKDKCKG